MSPKIYARMPRKHCDESKSVVGSAIILAIIVGLAFATYFDAPTERGGTWI